MASILHAYRLRNIMHAKSLDTGILSLLILETRSRLRSSASNQLTVRPSVASCHSCKRTIIVLLLTHRCGTVFHCRWHYTCFINDSVSTKSEHITHLFRQSHPKLIV